MTTGEGKAKDLPAGRRGWHLVGLLAGFSAWGKGHLVQWGGSVLLHFVVLSAAFLAMSGSPFGTGGGEAPVGVALKDSPQGFVA